MGDSGKRRPLFIALECAAHDQFPMSQAALRFETPGLQQPIDQRTQQRGQAIRSGERRRRQIELGFRCIRCRGCRMRSPVGAPPDSRSFQLTHNDDDGGDRYQYR